MRGRERAAVVVILGLSAAATGALAGFAAGVPASAFDTEAVPPWVAGSLVVLAVGADSRGFPPPSVRRQVPREWARLFSLRTAAMLYGGRLGVGPLTMLNTWLWWAALLMGASLGAGWSALVGGMFAVARISLMVAVGVKAAAAMSARMAEVVRRERAVARFATSVLLAACAALVLSACSGGARPTLEARRASTSSSSVVAEEGALALEDVLIRDGPPGFERVDDPGVTGPLDLDAAAASEPDEPAERALLETRGFRAGHARAWRDGDGTVLFALVYEFATPAGARAYRRDGQITLDGFGAESFGVPDVRGATGFTQVEDGVTVHGVTFARGRRFFLVFARGGDADDVVTPDDARALARAQADRV